MRREIDVARRVFLLLARLFDAFGGLLFFELRELILHGGAKSLISKNRRTSMIISPSFLGIREAHSIASSRDFTSIM